MQDAQPKRSSNAASKVRQSFINSPNPLTLVDIKKLHPDLLPSEISMALCYLRKQKYVSREQVKQDESAKGRKQVWQYTYHPQRLVSRLEIPA